MADSFKSRLIGLVGKSALHRGEGLILAPCNSIHSFFMRFKLDVLFLDRSQRVVFMIKGMPPNRIGPVIKNSQWVVELPEGIIASTGTKVGDEIGIFIGGVRRIG
ncbi:MAG: DUF192 domain-containing protein [Bacillota bacterium]